MYVTSHLCNARLMPGSWWCSQYLLRFMCPWWWCYAPPPPGNSNGVQDRVFKVPGNNVSNEDSGTQAPVTYNQQYQHPLQSMLYSRIQLRRRSECVKKAKWKYQCCWIDVWICAWFCPPCSQPLFMKSSPSRSDRVMKSEYDHAIIRTQYFSILYAGLYSWSIKPFWDI